MEHDEYCPHETPEKAPERRPPPKIGVYTYDPRVLRDRHNRAERAAATGPEFSGLCGKHGPTLFDTATGACLLCVADLTAHGLPPLLVYKTAGATLYPKPCPTHGDEALHLVQNSLCVECFAEQRGDPDRVRARRDGGKTFDAPCARCDSVTAHYVANGFCQNCFTSGGVPRKGERSTRNPERIRARAAGLTTYQGVCAIHGETAFHTVRGKCLQCFNTLGQPRKR